MSGGRPGRHHGKQSFSSFLKRPEIPDVLVASWSSQSHSYIHINLFSAGPHVRIIHPLPPYVLICSSRPVPPFPVLMFLLTARISMSTHAFINPYTTRFKIINPGCDRAVSLRHMGTRCCFLIESGSLITWVFVPLFIKE